MLQVANVLAQVELASIRLLDVVIVDVHLFAIVLQLDQHLSRLDVNATVCLIESDSRTKTPSMYQPDFLPTLAVEVAVEAILVRLCLQREKRDLNKKIELKILLLNQERECCGQTRFDSSKNVSERKA
jgi:hypothetical protein